MLCLFLPRRGEGLVPGGRRLPQLEGRGLGVPGLHVIEVVRPLRGAAGAGALGAPALVAAAAVELQRPTLPARLAVAAGRQGQALLTGEALGLLPVPAPLGLAVAEAQVAGAPAALRLPGSDLPLPDAQVALAATARHLGVKRHGRGAGRCGPGRAGVGQGLAPALEGPGRGGAPRGLEHEAVGRRREARGARARHPGAQHPGAQGGEGLHLNVIVIIMLYIYIYREREI